MKDFLNDYANLNLIEIILIALFWFLMERIYYFVKDRWKKDNNQSK